MKLARLFRPAHIPALLIMVLLFYLSSQQGNGLPALHHPLDKIVHACAYAVLGVAFCLWVSGERWTRQPITHGIVVAIACVAFGLTDEYHQSFVPGRMVSLGDLFADFIGSTLAIIFYVKLRVYKIADRYTFFRDAANS